MNITRKVLASVVTLCAASFLPAADSKPIDRVMAVTEIETDDATVYASWLANYNAAAKSKVGADRYVRVFETMMDGRKTGRVRIVVVGKSVAELTRNTALLENDLAAAQARSRSDKIREFGARMLYKCVRFDGSDPNSAVYTTLAVVNDEPGYLKALDQLRTLFDANGFKDAKINAYRILAGRTDHSHRISIGLPNVDRLAAFLDFTGSSPAAAEWIANSAKFRTVVSNTTARDITK
jgi:hypothetical protein